MSITELKEKRRQPAARKEKRREPENGTWLTIEELARITEPGHPKRSAEICRELALKAMKAAQS
jgi:hypothetical protein